MESRQSARWWPFQCDGGNQSRINRASYWCILGGSKGHFVCSLGLRLRGKVHWQSNCRQGRFKTSPAVDLEWNFAGSDLHTPLWTFTTRASHFQNTDKVCVARCFLGGVGDSYGRQTKTAKANGHLDSKEAGLVMQQIWLQASWATGPPTHLTPSKLGYGTTHSGYGTTPVWCRGGSRYGGFPYLKIEKFVGFTKFPFHAFW